MPAFLILGCGQTAKSDSGCELGQVNRAMLKVTTWFPVERLHQYIYIYIYI